MLYICPDWNCSQIGCRHKRPHRKRDTCHKPERGNIINGCKQPCVEATRSNEVESDMPDWAIKS